MFSGFVFSYVGLFLVCLGLFCIGFGVLVGLMPVCGLEYGWA